jgi:hypothetical protein
MARRGRFELPTPRFVVWCSIQLSYRRLPSRGAATGAAEGARNLASRSPLGKRGDAAFAHALRSAPPGAKNPASGRTQGLKKRAIPAGMDQALAATLSVDGASEKNRAWAMAAFTASDRKGLVIRKAGSGRSPVSRRSGKAVMKMIGTSIS